MSRDQTCYVTTPLDEDEDDTLKMAWPYNNNHSISIGMDAKLHPTSLNSIVIGSNTTDYGEERSVTFGGSSLYFHDNTKKYPNIVYTKSQYDDNMYIDVFASLDNVLKQNNLLMKYIMKKIRNKTIFPNDIWGMIDEASG